jgi:acid phosphatase
MFRRLARTTGIVVASVALLTGVLAPASFAGDNGRGKPADGPLGHFKHLVVIYEENHSFDNLYGTWGDVNGQHAEGIADATAAHTTQIDRNGAPYPCLLMSDVNLMSAPSGPLSPDCSDTPVTFPAWPTTRYHFSNHPFQIDEFIPATATTCPQPRGATKTFGFANGTGIAGGCTRDIVHRFYQEQYQLNGGQQNRYVTGSDAVGLTMGYYDTTALPIYRYLHENGAPNYVIMDRFFQAAFGGSFLNHQYLVAAAAPVFEGATPAQHSIIDATGFPNNTTNYPLGPKTAGIRDLAVTQDCGLPTTRTAFLCGDYAINTLQPFNQPTSGGAKQPLINDRTKPMTIGDTLTDAGVSWAWYSGGWDNAAGNVGGAGWTNGSGPNCGDPNVLAAPAVPTAGVQGVYPLCADRTFQFHHQPLNYFARYGPGEPGRAHLQDEQDFLNAVGAGELPAVSFVKPLGVENEHPGYASESNGSNHLVDLVQAVMNGPQAGNTLILVTYDEFGGQWDHVSPPGLGTPAAPGQADQFGPGTRLPAMLIGRSLTTSTVDHTVYDTTSIMRTIEKEYRLAPVAIRDAFVNDLGPAISAGRRGH